MMNSPTQTRHDVARKSLKALYMCQHSQMGGALNMQCAHISYTYICCLFDYLKKIGVIFCPIYMFCPFSVLSIFNSSAPAKLLAQALTPAEGKNILPLSPEKRFVLTGKRCQEQSKKIQQDLEDGFLTAKDVLVCCTDWHFHIFPL